MPTPQSTASGCKTTRLVTLLFRVDIIVAPGGVEYIFMNMAFAGLLPNIHEQEQHTCINRAVNNKVRPCEKP